MKVMIREFMSSEESGDEMIDGKRRAVIKVKPLPWRSSRIGRIFKRLDHKIEKRKSKQQTVPHVIGNRYLRQRLVGFASDVFGFEQDKIQFIFILILLLKV